MALQLELARHAYEVSLRLYPRDLRSRYGDDMADVFVCQLSQAQGSLTASARVWWGAYRDLLTIAIPGSATIPLVSVPSTSMVYAALSWALENPLRLNSIYHALVRSL